MPQCKPVFPNFSSIICVSSCFCWFFRQIKYIFAKWNISLIKYKIWIVKFEKCLVFLSYSILIPLALLTIPMFFLMLYPFLSSRIFPWFIHRVCTSSDCRCIEIFRNIPLEFDCKLLVNAVKASCSKLWWEDEALSYLFCRLVVAMPPICFLEQTNLTPKWFFQKINKTHQKTSKIETNKKKKWKKKYLL